MEIIPEDVYEGAILIEVCHLVQRVIDRKLPFSNMRFFWYSGVMWFYNLFVYCVPDDTLFNMIPVKCTRIIII